MASIFNKIMTGGFIFGVGGMFATQFLYTVPAGHRAILFDRIKGVRKEVKSEGMHFLLPILQWPINYEIRTRPTKIDSQTGSKDLQTVTISLRLLYRPDADKLYDIHSKLGPQFDQKTLPSVGNEVLKAVVAQYDASELITQRELVSKQIRERITKRAKEFNIILDDVAITHLSFSPEFTSAIERKQVAQQEAERQKFVVAKAEQEKKAAIIRAEGEAEAARLMKEAAKFGTGFIELRRIQATREIVETLARARNVTYLPNSGGVLLNIGDQKFSPPPPEDSN